MESLQDNFWRRNGLEDKDRTECLAAVQGSYDGYHIEEFKHQGYCSFTLLLSPRARDEKDKDVNKSNTYLAGSKNDKQLIVQLRSMRHALDLDTALAARNTYSALAPVVRAVNLCLPGGIQAYEMNKMEGTPFSRLQPHISSTRADVRRKQEMFITSFAKIIAQRWPIRESTKRRDSVLRSESPHDNGTTFSSLCTGKVGSNIVKKLEELSEKLPDEWLRARTDITLEKLCNIQAYPVVLNHGDLIPSNILVDEETWNITGLVDWAEAEWLPFGTCLYGLEHLLGSLRMPSHGSGTPAFDYYDNAVHLRERFWSTLIGLVSELDKRIEEVKVMRDIGILLWHGYAWDGGAIDRVVDEVNDREELTKLRAFLSN